MKNATAKKRKVSRKIAERYAANGLMLNQTRTREGCSLRDLASQIGVNASTLCRLENGKEVGAFAYIAAMLWTTMHVRNVT